MYRPGGDLPQLRHGGTVPIALPPPGVMSVGSSFTPPPLPGGAFGMAQFSGRVPGFLPPIPTVPPPLPSVDLPPFVPPLPQSPPADVPPPPSPSPPPLPLDESSSSVESLPPEPPMPSDSEMLKNIEVLAAFVAKNGPQYESMARAKHAGNPKFGFLFESGVDHEAVIGHEFYKWKKQALEVEFRLGTKNKDVKNLISDKFSGHAQAIHMTGQSVVPKPIPGSPTMSDMDMEDDIAIPFPKRELVGQFKDVEGGTAEKAGHLSSKKATTSAEADKFESSSRVEKFPEMQQIGGHPLSSDGLLTGTHGGETLNMSQLENLARGNSEQAEKARPLNRSESAERRLKGEQTGFIIDKIYNDSSDSSEDLQPSENVGKAGEESSDLGIIQTDQNEETEQGDAILGQAVNGLKLRAAADDLDDMVWGSSDSPVEKALILPQEHQRSRLGSPQYTHKRYGAKRFHSYGSPLNMDKGFQSRDRDTGEECCGPSHSNSIRDAGNSSKDSERPASIDRTGGGDLEDEPSSTAAQQHAKQNTVTVDENGRLIHEGASDSNYSEDDCLPKRKRRRYSRSRSQSSGDVSLRRQSLRDTPPRQERHSRSGSESPQEQRSDSRSLSRDLNGGLGRAEGEFSSDWEFQERGSGGGRGTEPNLCVYYARGRCFKGSSCRFLHQSRNFIPPEQDLSTEEVQVKKFELEVSTADKESGEDVSSEKKLAVESVQQSHSAAGNNAEADETDNMAFNTQSTAGTHTMAVVKAEACTQVYSENETEADGEMEIVEEPKGSTDVGLFRRSVLKETEETKKAKLSAEHGVFLEAECGFEINEIEKPMLTAEAVFMKPGLSLEMEETKKPEVSAEGILRKPEFSLEMKKKEKSHVVAEMFAHTQAEVATERGLPEKPLPKTAVELSPFRDEYLFPSVPRGQPYQGEVPRGSVSAIEPFHGVALPPFSPFQQSKAMWQSNPIGNSSLTSQSYLGTGQSYHPGNSVLGLNQANSSQYPLCSTNVPPYVELSSFSEPLDSSNTNLGNNFRATGPPNLVQPFTVGTQFSGQLTGGKLGTSQPYSASSLGPSQQGFLPSMYGMPSVSQSQGPPMQTSNRNTFPVQPVLPQFSVPSNPSVLPPFNQSASFSMNPSTRQSQATPINSASMLTSVQHGYSSSFSLPIQQSFFPRPFVGDTSKQFTFPSLKNDGLQDVYSRSLPTLSAPASQNSMPWMRSESLDASASPPVSAALPPKAGLSSSYALPPKAGLSSSYALPPKAGLSSSYAYALTTIPPLSNLINLPGVSDISASGDQYDPLSDSLEPSSDSALKAMSYDFVKASGNSKSMGLISNTIVPHLENVSPGPVTEKANIVICKPDIIEAEIAIINDAAADPGVGIVENVSPPDDDRNWSPQQAMNATETGDDQVQAKIKKSSRGLKLLRSAVAEYVKDVLKPTWRGGQMSKDAFKTIVKKVVDKVTATLPTHHIPKSQEKVDQFMASSRSKISKLVQGYVDKYQKA